MLGDGFFARDADSDKVLLTVEGDGFFAIRTESDDACIR